MFSRDEQATTATTLTPESESTVKGVMTDRIEAERLVSDRVREYRRPTSMDPLLTVDDDLRTGTIVDRPNRFVVRVRFGDSPERAFLGDPGALENIVEPGREILCRPVDDPDRATDYDAIAVRVTDTYVSVRTALANDLFEQAVRLQALPGFEGYTFRRREPPLPEHGRTDFLLETPDGDSAYVEVKSCTHVEAGVAKFPDRQTERGRRHLRSLDALSQDGHDTHVVFVVQRPDVERFAPFRDVDPAFADLLGRVQAAGVRVHAFTTAFDPPHYWLRERALPIDLS